MVGDSKRHKQRRGAATGAAFVIAFNGSLTFPLCLSHAMLFSFIVAFGLRRFVFKL